MEEIEPRCDCRVCGLSLKSSKTLRCHQNDRCPVAEEIIDRWCTICRQSVPKDECGTHYGTEHSDVTVKRSIVDSAELFITQLKELQLANLTPISLLCRGSAKKVYTYICSSAQPITASRKTAANRAPAERGILRQGISCPFFARVKHLPNGKATVEMCDMHSHAGDVNVVGLDEATETTITQMLLESRDTRFIKTHFKTQAHSNQGEQ